MSKLLVILGATGNQGGSVIKSILSDPKAAKQFQLRGVTRDTSSAKAQALASKGVEVVSANVDDTASLKKAFEGAYGIFALTDFWAAKDGAKETQQGKNIADACKATGVEHLVYSTLENVTKATNGQMSKVYHFDSKANAADYMESLSIPLTRFMPGYYLSNLPSSFRPGSDGGALTHYIPVAPATKIPIFHAEEDTGKFVKAIFLKPEQTVGKTVRGATTDMSFADIASTLAKLRPGKAKGATITQVPREAFKQNLQNVGMSEDVAEDLTEMYEFFALKGYFNGAKPDTDLLDEPATTFEEFVEGVEKWKE